MSKCHKIAAGLLGLLLVMCFGMVTLGGWVRLSGSGLSIPQWPLFTVAIEHSATGEIVEKKTVIPPSDEIGWEHLRDTYAALVPGQDAEMAVSEFKRIFWVEWSHRASAASIGIAYLAFLIVAVSAPTLRREIGVLAVCGLVLLLSQAAIGGLLVLVHLEALKLSLHLIVAFLFTSLLLWMFLRLVHPISHADGKLHKNGILGWAVAVYTLIGLQIMSGGLMAGTGAGHQINTWPTMNGMWVPRNLVPNGMSFVQSFTENIVLIQFVHRWFAMLVAVSILLFVFRCMTVGLPRVARWSIRIFFTLVVLQVVLGILTLLKGVMPHLALTHQSVGLLLFLNGLLMIYETAAHPVRMESQALAEDAEYDHNGGGAASHV